ncbi:MAG: TatD family hydrolase [Gammaproteobacteria bacterium]
MHELIDIGANLTHDSFDQDRAAVIERAQEQGVTRMIVTGATVDGSRDAITMAEQHPGKLWATTGVHPHHAAEYLPDGTDELRKLAGSACVVAVGECGLDYFRNFSPREAQLSAFAEQLGLAVETAKPVFLHQRDAHEDFLAVLGDFKDRLTGGVAHCFTGTTEQMQAYLDLGFYIGITGWICDERRGMDLQSAVAHLPLDRVLLETDAPYLMPRDLPNKPDKRRNEPATLRHTLNTTAALMNLDAEELAAAATKNTERLFGIGNSC